MRYEHWWLDFLHRCCQVGECVSRCSNVQQVVYMRIRTHTTGWNYNPEDAAAFAAAQELVAREEQAAGRHAHQD